MLKVCAPGQTFWECKIILFPEHPSLIVGIVFMLVLVFIGWCFYDWVKHPENWEGSNTVEEAKIEDVKQ